MYDPHPSPQIVSISASGNTPALLLCPGFRIKLDLRFCLPLGCPCVSSSVDFLKGGPDLRCSYMPQTIQSVC